MWRENFDLPTIHYYCLAYYLGFHLYARKRGLRAFSVASSHHGGRWEWNFRPLPSFSLSTTSTGGCTTVKMGSKSKKLARKPSFKTAPASSLRRPPVPQPRRSEITQPPASQHSQRKWEMYPPSAQSRLVMGYYNSENYCCDDCSLPSSDNEYWPPRTASVPHKYVPAVQTSKSTRKFAGSRSSKTPGSTVSRKSLASSHHQRYNVMTMTKTLVSLKSCRSVSEIETLPPSGYLASTVIQKATYINDDFVSDDEVYEEPKYACRDICCKER